MAVGLAPVCVTVDYRGFGFGMAYTTTNTASQAPVPAEKAGAASGATVTGLVVDAALAVTISAAIAEHLQGTIHPAAEAITRAFRVVNWIGVAMSLAAAAVLVLVLKPARQGSRHT